MKSLINKKVVNAKRNRWLKVSVAIFIILVTLILGSIITVRKVYYDNLKPVSGSQKSQIVTIPIGSSPHEIAVILEKAGVIRKIWVFEWYIRNNNYRDKLLAGTYALNPSQSVSEIVNILIQGRVDTDLVTIFPGKRIDQIRDDLINQGFNAEEVDEALIPEKYINHPVLTDKPPGDSLEGYLYPESFQKTADTKVETIIESSLDEMQKRMTPQIRAGFVRQGMTAHQGVILASIIEQEVGHIESDTDLEVKKKVAQVFLKRLKENMSLESDATSGYGAVLAGEDPKQSFSSPYNTYENPGLTPTPISNVGENSLIAVSNPSTTDYLFFVAGNDCVTRFSRTLDEHEKLKRSFGIGCEE